MPPEEPKRQRATKAMIQQYGRNTRVLWNEYAPVKQRVEYLCDVLFGGDHHQMSLAIGMCHRHLYRVLYGHSRLSVRLAGQMVMRLGVRAEWLLCGSGPVFPWPTQTDVYNFVPVINSCLYTFDPHEHVPGTYFLPKVPKNKTDVIIDKSGYAAAAKAVFQARVHKKPVAFFLGRDSFTKSTPAVFEQFFEQRYANVLLTTLAGACLDLAAAGDKPAPDINCLAKTAAATGRGYGETICADGFLTPRARQKSLLAKVFDMSLPVIVSAEVGEVPNHTHPSVRAPELGAAVGAAAYIDLLGFTEQVPQFFGKPGGVYIVAGEVPRGVDFFLQRLEPLSFSFPEQDGFVMVLFCERDAASKEICEKITRCGGRPIVLDAPTMTAFQQLLSSCDEAYAGTI